MKRRIVTVLMAVAVLFCSMPLGSFAATSNISMDDKAVLYTPANDYKSGDCILSSSKTMIRRAAIQRGSKLWSQTSNASIRKDATILGLLLHNFTHSTDGLAYTVKCATFSGTTETARIKEFEKLLKEHPEGIVVWGKKASIFGQHGVLVTGVKNGVVYAADSYYNKGSYNKGIQKWSETSMYSPLKCTQYWYIKEVSLAKGAKAPAKGKPLAPASATNVNTASTLRISDATKPVSITQGDGYPVRGVVESNYRLSNVSVTITNSAGKTVISQSVNPNGWIYDLLGVDAKVKFGTLATGTYRYKVTAKDEKKTATLVDGSFKVEAKKAPAKTTAKAKSKLRIKSYNAPSTLKLGKPYSIKGKIASNKKIKKVTIEVVNSSGKVVLSASAKPNKKSYNIKKLDAKIKFGKLAKGTYTYRISAKDTAQTKTLVTKSFKVE